jgi:hypothetical protein
MEGLLPLALTIGLSGTFLYATAQKKKQGFEDLVNPAVSKAFGDKHAQYIRDGASRFNPLMNLMNPSINPLYPEGASLSQVKEQEKNVQNALFNIDAQPNNPSFDIQKDKRMHVAINTGSGGPGVNTIKMCEKLMEVDCNKFDDSNFAYSCGICHEEGRDSTGNTKVGGLYVTEDTKLEAEENARAMNAKRPNYTPSVGKCAPQRFTTTKEQCIRLKKQMECEMKKDFSMPGCSQCYQDGSFKYLDEGIAQSGVSLFLVGSGKYKITKLGTERVISEGTLSQTPQEISLGDLQEGDNLMIGVFPVMTGLFQFKEPPKVAGYIQGKTLTGDMTMDINRMIQVDTTSNVRPSIASFVEINDMSYAQMRPARGKLGMTLLLTNTFTFIETGEEEAALCPSAPFITKEKSAEILESSPCYKKGSGPGKYSQECLQELWVGAGCEAAGEGYPTTDKLARELMTDDNGNALTISKIATKINTASSVSYTGRLGGKRLTIPEWDRYSRFCTGKKITSPCDMDNKETGPLSADCLAYLWDNVGATDNIPGGLGPTYTNSKQFASLNVNDTTRYCTRDGTFAPVNKNGEPNDNNINKVNEESRGRGVRGVKDVYNRIHAYANANGLPDEMRETAIQQCYGVELVNRTSVDKSNALMGANCTPEVLRTTLTNPTGAIMLGIYTIRDTWTISFKINLTGTAPNWMNLVHLTSNNSDISGFGSRSPGLWTFPNSTRLHFSMVTENNVNFVIDSAEELPLNQDIEITMSYEESMVSLKINGGGINKEYKQRFPTKFYRGNVRFYSPDPWYAPFKGVMTDLRYCSTDSLTTSVLDNNSGRTKSPQQIANYQYTDWSKFSKQVNSLGKLGIGPWSPAWTGAMNSDGNPQWIWNTPNAQNDAPSNVPVPLFKRFQNNTGSAITLTLYMGADNNCSLFINDTLATQFGGAQEINMRFPTGESKIQADCMNHGGPAGFILSAKDDKGKVYFVTDSSWTTRS